MHIIFFRHGCVCVGVWTCIMGFPIRIFHRTNDDVRKRIGDLVVHLLYYACIAVFLNPTTETSNFLAVPLPRWGCDGRVQLQRYTYMGVLTGYYIIMVAAK